MKQYNNSEAISKPPSHCDEDIGDGWNMLYAMLFTSLGILIFHSCFIQTLIYFLSCCIHKETARVKVLARLDKLQSNWGSWEGDNVDDQELVPPNPSAFGAAYTLAFIPICAYTIYQLILYLAIVIYSKTITTLSKYLYIIQNNQEVVEVIINVKCPIV